MASSIALTNSSGKKVTLTNPDTNTTDMTLNLSDVGFASLLSGNGYQKLPSGLILQWGNIPIGTGATGTVTFPIPFPTACFSVSTSTLYNGSSTSNCNINTVTTTGFYLYIVSSATYGVMWFAVGY